MESTISKLANRFKEPSSWAGLAALAALLGVNVDAGVIQDIGLIGAGVAGLVAFFLPEKKS